MANETTDFLDDTKTVTLEQIEELKKLAQDNGKDFDSSQIKTMADYLEIKKQLTEDKNLNSDSSMSGPQEQTEIGAKEENSDVLTISEMNPQQSQFQNGTDKDWIAIKAEYYESISSELKDYKRDTSVDGFAASFNNAKIHYTSENNVQVTPEAGIEVFERMLGEPGNDTKVINFSENMPPEMAAKLLAACILKSNKITGNVPEITDEVKKIIKDALTAENADTAEAKYREFEEKLTARTVQNAENTQPQQQTAQNQEQNHDENIAALQKIRAKFTEMKTSGLIKIVEQEGKPQIVAGNDSAEAKEAVTRAMKIMEEAAKLVKEGKTAAVQQMTDAEQRNEVFDRYNQERIALVRSRRTDEQNKSHDDKEIARNAARKQMAVKMGILPENESIKDKDGNVVRKMDDDKIDTSSLLYARLQQRFQNTQ